MVALKGSAVDAFLQKGEIRYAAVLLYGPDNGLVRARADALAGSIVPGLKDPFSYVELTDSTLKTEPSRLADESVALSFTGGRRVIRLRTGGDACLASVKNFLSTLKPDRPVPAGVVLVEAGALTPRSGLRKAFEQSGEAVALPCYRDSPEAVRATAVRMASDEGLFFEDDALALAVSVLGDDHARTRMEIEKLVLYKGPADSGTARRPITVRDVSVCLLDGTGDVMNDVAAGCLDGAVLQLSAALDRARAAGIEPVALLRVLQRHFLRLDAVTASVNAGLPASAAMQKLKPPVFFTERRAFEKRMHAWRPGRKITRAVTILAEAEAGVKSGRLPQRMTVERTALRLARMA